MPKTHPCRLTPSRGKYAIDPVIVLVQVAKDQIQIVNNEWVDLLELVVTLSNVGRLRTTRTS